MRKQLFTSDKKDWTSPAPILDRVRMVRPIGLDPCDGKGSIVKARLNMTIKQDGLVNPWPRIWAKECAFINWPYGNKENKQWARKCVEQLKTHPEQFHLVAARTSETWLQDIILAAKPTAIAFCHKRLRFSNAKHVATFPSMVVYFGKKLKEFTAAFEDICWVVPHPKRGTYPIGRAPRTLKAAPSKRAAAKKPVAKKTEPTRKKAPVVLRKGQAKAVRAMTAPPAPVRVKMPTPAVRPAASAPRPTLFGRKVIVGARPPVPAVQAPRFGRTRLAVVPTNGG